MRRTPGSPVAVVNAIALTIATVLTGAWESSGHGHDPAAANAAYCAADHDNEAAPAGVRATVGEATSAHGHSCVACKLGRWQTAAERRKSTVGSPYRLAAAVGPWDANRPTSGDFSQRTARGPPTG